MSEIGPEYEDIYKVSVKMPGCMEGLHGEFKTKEEAEARLEESFEKNTSEKKMPHLRQYFTVVKVRVDEDGEIVKFLS